MSKFNSIYLIVFGSILLFAAIVDCYSYRNEIVTLNKRISELEAEVKYYKIMEELDDSIQLKKNSK